MSMPEELIPERLADPKSWELMSTAEKLALQPGALDYLLSQLTDEQVAGMLTDWEGFWARPSQMEPDGDWREWLLLTGRGFGKLLALDTPVPTPTGWTAIGDVQIGDEVFDESGRVCNVTATYDDAAPPSTYEMTFSDGSKIRCCGEHLWVTWDGLSLRRLREREPGLWKAGEYPEEWPSWRSDERGPEIRTTEQIRGSLTRGDHWIPLAAPLDLPEQDLLVDPYLLGYWLGNGSAVIDRVPGLLSGLAALGLQGTKFIPRPYLRSSERQRRSLLAGMMDSDGHHWKNAGLVEWSSMSREMADDMFELVASLGEQPRRDEHLEGKEFWTCYRVSWSPRRNPFRLPRKAGRWRPRQAMRAAHRTIVSIEPVASEPMRCLSVDSKHSTFLVGEAMVPTHNTRTCAEWCYKRVQAGSRSGFLLGRTTEQVRDIQVNGPDGLLAVAEKHGTPWTYKSSEAIVVTHTGSTWKMHTSEKPDSVRGPTYDTGWVEEFATLKAMVGADGMTAFDNARFTLRAVGELQPRLVMATTPKRVTAVKKMLLDHKDPNKKIRLTRGSLRENTSNLADSFVAGILDRYAGTALGQQEIDGELASDVEGSIFSSEVFARTRIVDERDLPELLRPILSIDPSVGDGSGDTCGMTVQALSAGTIPTEIKHGNLSVIRDVRHGYVLEDCSIAADPDTWANHAVEVCERYGILEVVAEGNQGQRLITSMLKSRNSALRVKLVNARVGKEARAQPVAGLFSQGRWHMVGEHPTLEDVCTTWVPGRGQESPDEMDAMVWGATHLEPGINKKNPKAATPPGAFGKSL